MAGETALTLVGNLTSDPELRLTPQGVSVCVFSIATTPRRYDRDAKRWDDGETMFLRCTAWRDLAEHVAESLTRGARVIVTGTLSQRSYEHREGHKVTVCEVAVDEVGPSLRFATATVNRAARAMSGVDATGFLPPVPVR